MRKLKLLFLSGAALAVSASSAGAQTCLGLPSFDKSSVHFNARSDFPEAATSYALGLGTGRPNNMFANFGAGQVKFDDVSGKQTLGFLEFGYQLPAGPLQFCPVAGGYLSKGPNDDAAGTKASGYGATGGAAVGVALRLNSFKVIPNVAATYDYARSTFKDPNDELTEDYQSAALSLGLSLVLFDRVSIQPLARVPLYSNIDGDNEKTSFGVFLSVSIPWKAQEN